MNRPCPARTCGGQAPEPVLRVQEVGQCFRPAFLVLLALTEALFPGMRVEALHWQKVLEKQPSPHLDQGLE